jgi:hypothetical protein
VTAPAPPLTLRDAGRPHLADGAPMGEACLAHTVPNQLRLTFDHALYM